MDLKDLKIFKTVCENGSFSRASEEGYMTPQGVSKIIQRLENEFGAALFVRTPKGVIPTACGNILYERCQELINLYTAILDDMRMQEHVNEVSVAFSYGVLSYLGMDFKTAFESSASGMILNITEEPDNEIEQLIQNGQLGLGVIGMPMNLSSYEIEPLFSCRHVAVVNDKSVLAEKAILDYWDLDHQAIALVGHQFNPYHQNIYRFKRAGITPESLYETSEINFTHSYAAQNKGIGISVDFVAQDNPYPNTRVLHFKDAGFTWDVCLVLRKGYHPTKAEQFFITFIKKYLECNKRNGT